MNEHVEPPGWSRSSKENLPNVVPADGRREAALWSPGFPPADAASQDEGGNIAHDLMKYFWILFRHRWVVLGVLAVVVCAGLLFTFLTTPIYRASTTLQIDREPAKV